MTPKCYQKHKEKFRKEPHERYQNLPDEEKYKRRKKARQKYQNFIEEEKQIILFLRNKRRK